MCHTVMASLAIASHVSDPPQILVNPEPYTLVQGWELLTVQGTAWKGSASSILLKTRRLLVRVNHSVYTDDMP